MSEFPKKHHHSLRFYIVMTTIVIGGIFFLLLANDGNKGGFTSAVVESAKNVSLRNIISNNLEEEQDQLATIPSKDLFDEQKHRVNFKLSSETIPAVQKIINAKEVQISSSTPSPEIKVNDDKLELNDLNKLDLKITGFSGSIAFDNTLLSLEGTAKQISVNGVSLSASNKIKVSISGLEYDQGLFNEMSLNDLEFTSEKGSLSVGNTLVYTLEEEYWAAIYEFFGSLTLDKSNPSSVSVLEGNSQGIDIIGESLNLNLR